jgi:NF-X1-type zinc finger protein NFXL1
VCHAGECPMEKKCLKKVTLKCECKRIKKECVCKDVGKKTLDCDQTCKQEQKKKQQVIKWTITFVI